MADEAGDKEPEIFRELEPAEVLQLVEKRDAVAGEKLSATERRMAAIADELIGDPDLTVEYYIDQHLQSRSGKVLGQRMEELDPRQQVEEINRYRRLLTWGRAFSTGTLSTAAGPASAPPPGPTSAGPRTTSTTQLRQ